MPLYGDRSRRNFEPKATPATKADYRASIIDYMKHSGENAKNAETAPRHNPDRLPEMLLWNNSRMAKRMWTVAQEMVADGTVRITNGSFEEGSVYIVAGDNWVD